MIESIVEKPNADEWLKEIFRRLMELYERHTQERQLLIKEKEEIAQLVQLLVSQVKEIGQYENGIRKRIQDSIKESSNIAMNNIEQSITKKTIKCNEEFIDKLTQLCKSAELAIEGFRAEKRKFSWQIFAAAILSGALSGLLVAWILLLGQHHL